MTTAISKPITIRVSALPRFYANLAQALAQAGINGSQLDEICSACLKVSCTRCDIHLTHAEIEQVSLAEDASQLSHPKLKRLRLGYCARDGCESDDYQIQLAASPNVDWDAIVTKANDLLSVQQAAEKETVRSQKAEQRKHQAKRNVLALLILAVAILLMFVWRNGRLPFVKKTPKYQIDPASTSPAPRR